MTLGLAYADADWPHGLRCADCHTPFVSGMRYSERLTTTSVHCDSFTFHVQIVCVACALAETPTEETAP